MRYRTIVLFSLSLFGATSLPAMAIEGCDKKIIALERQIIHARKQGDHARLRGLERALEKIESYCGGKRSAVTDNSSQSGAGELEYRWLFKVQEKLFLAKEEVFEAEYALKKAKLEGDAQKIMEKEQILEKSRLKLEMYEEYLAELREEKGV